MDDKYNWKIKRDKQAFLALETGDIFYGYSIGAERGVVGEVGFNTGMPG